MSTSARLYRDRPMVAGQGVSASERHGSNDLMHLGGDAFLLDKLDKTNHSNDPEVIAIFGWMDGQPRHIRKYADKYRELYPASKVLLIQSHSNYFWSSSSTREERVQPAVDLLAPLQIGTKTASVAPTLHVHAFSNGGSLQMIQIARMLRQRSGHVSASFRGLPASSIVIDSAPGGNALAPLLTAFTVPYRSQIVRTLLYIPISLTWALLALSSLVLRRPSPIDVLRQDMLDPTLLPKGTPRLYIYSKADTIIRYEEVESHIAEAKRADLQIEQCVYESSAHVSHARSNATQYWSAIGAILKQSCESQ